MNLGLTVKIRVKKNSKRNNKVKFFSGIFLLKIKMFHLIVANF